MATLEKIKICGIRSFGCEEEDVQTVQFQKPLTLILGENGCGKSTIIECLRYLTAQKEPSGKGTFVHDPSLTNKATVKGFIKLRMRDVKGEIVDLCRQVQATRTKKALTTKSLDNVITRTNRDTREKVSISNRCADFTYEISRIFGVSRAILENVVFCTQEDSHWPLDTDQKLKEKFDQIFDSDKYNKCVNKVREERKKIKDVLKNSEVELKYLKENKTMAVEKRRLIEKMKKQIEGCNAEIQNLNSSLKEVEDKLKDVNEKEMHMSKNQALKDAKKVALKGLEEHIVELRSRIRNMFEGSDEELKNEIENFTKISSEREQEIGEEEKRIKDWNEKEARLSRDVTKEQVVLGQLFKEEEMNKERVKERNVHLKKLADQLKIDVPSQQVNEESFRNFLTRVKAKVRDEEDELEKLKLMLEEEEEDLQSNIDKIREESLVCQNEVQNRSKSLENCRLEISKISKELEEMDRSATKLARLESSLLNVDKELKELSGAINPEELKREMASATEERNNLQELLSEIEEKVKILHQQSTVSTELNLQKEMKSSKDSQIRRLMNKHKENLKGVLGTMPKSNFKSAVQNQIEIARQKVKELNARRSKKEKELTELEMKRKHIKEKLRVKEELLRSNEEEIYDVCGSTDYEETIAAVKKQLEDLQDMKGTLSSSEHMYQRYIRALEKSEPCCPLCHRDFEQQTEAQALVEELMSKVREVPNRLSQNKTQLEEKQSKYNRLLTLRSKYDQLEVLKGKEIPALRSEFEQTEASLKKVQKELNDLEGELYSPQADEAICTSLQDDMVLLDQLHSESTRIEKQIDKLQKEMGDKSASKDALKNKLNEQDATRQKLTQTRQRVEELQSKLSNFNEELQLKQATKNSLMEEVNKIHGSVGQKSKQTEQLKNLKSSESQLKSELDSLQKKLEMLKKNLQDAIGKKNTEKARNGERIAKLSETVREYSKQLQEIDGWSKLIETHERKGVDERIEVVQEKMKELEEEMKELKIKREEGMKRVEEMKRKLSNQELRERELGDNLKLREKTAEVKNLKKEVAVLEEKFGNANFDLILKEKRKLKGKEEEIGKSKAQIQGRQSEMENQLRLLEKELLSKIYRTVDEDYNKECLKHEVLKAMGNDLDRYAITMEYAMMTYHKQQMTRVNAFIREYWRKIYQGNDIDYIEIQTDNIESTEKRRNYNYKVIQIKSDIHLDMRNRCSAGQKMLASLIIRLALAETFSGNCGILTLDEPTTNLDRKNIKNLARTLNEILLAKQNTSNPNFQLIVITHDEEFLQELMELEIVNEYVKVDRNQRGRTKVSTRILTGTELNIIQANRYPERPVYEYD